MGFTKLDDGISMSSIMSEDDSVFKFMGTKKIDGAPDCIRGNLSGISGDLGDCEISDDDRVRGVTVDEIVE